MKFRNELECRTAANETSERDVADHAASAALTTYATEGSFTEGESFILGPGGIAHYLFTMMSVLQYEGEYVKVESNFANNVSLLNRLSLSGGRAEWTNMNAQIQEIEEDWGRKETRVRVGASKHLSADQLSALLNMWRFRRTWYNPLLKADNTAGGTSGDIVMPTTAGQSNVVEGLENESHLAATYYTSPPSANASGIIGGQINNTAQKIHTVLSATTPTAVDPAKDPKIVDPKEVVFCDESGALMYAVALVSGFYTKE